MSRAVCSRGQQQPHCRLKEALRPLHPEHLPTRIPQEWNPCHVNPRRLAPHTQQEAQLCACASHPASGVPRARTPSGWKAWPMQGHLHQQEGLPLWLAFPLLSCPLPPSPGTSELLRPPHSKHTSDGQSQNDGQVRRRAWLRLSKRGPDKAGNRARQHLRENVVTRMGRVLQVPWPSCLLTSCPRMRQD